MRWITLSALMMIPLLAQVDHYAAILHGKGDLRCPHCRVGELEGKGFNDGLRTMFVADGGVSRIKYSRFQCKNPCCTGITDEQRRRSALPGRDGKPKSEANQTSMGLHDAPCACMKLL